MLITSPTLNIGDDRFQDDFFSSDQNTARDEKVPEVVLIEQVFVTLTSNLVINSVTVMTETCRDINHSPSIERTYIGVKIPCFLHPS